jgi:GH15 family glucan-1,4-alpha-glucosidase
VPDYLKRVSPRRAIIRRSAEWPDGELNWDYRYTWLRDTALFVNTLFRFGYSGEAKAFFEFSGTFRKPFRTWR